MNCFYHQNRSAVGLCKSCARGICPDCAADISNGLACSKRCEERAKRINRAIDSNDRLYSVANTQLRRNTIFSIISGLVFLPFGWWMGFGDHGMPGAFFIVLGVALILRGILAYTKAARYPEA